MLPWHREGVGLTSPPPDEPFTGGWCQIAPKEPCQKTDNLTRFHHAANCLVITDLLIFDVPVAVEHVERISV
jgi:hypothetical protein